MIFYIHTHMILPSILVKVFFLPLYISGLARPQGRQKKKTLSRIPFKAPKPKGPARLLLYINVLDFWHFHIVEIRGSLCPIVTKLWILVVLLFCHFWQSLKKFGQIEPKIWAVVYWFFGYRIGYRYIYRYISQNLRSKGRGDHNLAVTISNEVK